MPHPLEERVQSVALRARRLGSAYAWGKFLIALLVLILVAGLADYFLRPHDAGVRIILSLGVLGIAVWLFRWLVLTGSWRPQTLVPVAQRIERRFPQLGERLSSAIAFLAQGEQNKTAGSADLRRAVVAQAESLTTDLDFQQAVDARQPQRVLQVLAMVTIALAIVAALNSQATAIALGRLVLPWQNRQWPARHNLAFVNPPEMIAAGQNFEVEVLDKNGTLPEVVQIQIRQEADGRSRVETREMKQLGDRMVFRLDNVTRPFDYRVFGGDDQAMPWQALRVVNPPRVIDVAVEVQPPPYTGLAKQTGGKLVRVLAGSTLAVKAKVDKPVLSARLQSDAVDAKLPAVQIGEDGMTLVAPAKDSPPWRAEKSGTYWLEVAGEENLPGGREPRLEVQVTPDLPPSISWDTPTDHTFVTPRALVPLKCLIKDDLAIRSVKLKYLRPDFSDQGEFIVVLYDGPAKVRPKKGDDRGGESRTIETMWDLAAIPGLQVGSVLAVRLTAEDYKPQEATATIRRITIISDEELESRVTQKQTAILEQLAEALRLQREARGQTAALEIQLRETGKLTAREFTLMEAAELNQRNVQRQMSDPQDGMEAQIAALLAELEANRLANQAAAARMKELLGKVREINRQPLPAISQELTAAIKSARESLEKGGDGNNCGDDLTATSRSLSAAGKEQDEVVARLEAMLGELSQWDNFSRLAREVSQIRFEEEKLARDTETLQLKGAAATAPEGADNRAAARQLGQRQLELARRFDKLQTRMEELLTRLRQSDPLVAGTLADALDAGRRFAIGGQMRAAAGDLAEQRLGPAAQAEQQVLDNLKELLDLISSRRDRELARGAKSLGDAATELDTIARRHQELQKEVGAAAAEKNEAENKRKLERLTPELKQLAEEVAELSRKLERLRARRAAEAGSAAGSSLAQAGDAAQGGDGDEAQNQSRKAKDLLDEARRELQQQIKQTQQDLQREELARLEQLIQALALRERGVLKETVRLEGLRDKKTGQLKEPQQAALRQTALEQRSLADETSQLAPTLAAAKAFVLTLDAAQREMLAAADALQRGETGAASVKAESAALARLDQLLAALKPDESTSSDPPEPPPGGDGQNQGNPPTLQNLAELKLLKLMQETIHTRTVELEEARRKTGELSEEQLRELESLGREQGQLADRVLEMIRAAAERPEDDLGNLPNPGDKPPGDGDNKKCTGKKDSPQRESLEDNPLRELERKKK